MKVKTLMFSILMLPFLIKITLACEVTKITGGCDRCTTTFFGTILEGIGCSEILVPKKSPGSESIVVLEGSTYLYGPRPLAFPCILSPCEDPSLFDKNNIIKGYMRSMPDITYGCSNVSQQFGCYPLEGEQATMYRGPNCEVMAESKVGKETIIHSSQSMFTSRTYVAKCNGDVVERAFYVEEIFVIPGNVEAKCLFTECTEKYKGRCSEACGGDLGCSKVFPNSIGCCDEYCKSYCLCNEQCKAEKVNWNDVFYVKYIVNGVEVEAKGSEVIYRAGPGQELHIKVLIDVRDDYKGRLNLNEEKIKIVKIVACKPEIIGEYEIGREITLPTIKFPKYGWYTGESSSEESFSCTDVIKFIPSIVKESPIGPYERKIETYVGESELGTRYLYTSLSLPALKITPVVEAAICSRLKMQEREYVVLSNRSTLYDPGWELWNKCCKDGIIDISLVGIENVIETDEKGVTKESGYRFKFKVKDNRDPICEELFGKWELDITANYTSYIKPLQRGNNALSYEVELRPRIFSLEYVKS